ncbi:NAD(P)-dependent oxidoreductase [Piscinibacter gummiphilus]|uniref:3-hydroxyisobutyrate dehydrogenase n=1 Tax=Piscinibacter gummiphilus TaxID=946333 RepID=A0A1W6L437_9BURK|nr:NAD(P)-binding domain-containing protein [Piscinibacter gummiphilus]ARN19004.1 3-hydroxyisobutyrate dehydrogenase [Piscinibacter gummiphilus]ATU63649.1 NAD(P)-dependent oxidoreductase [Piscinibacter gummiphilus]GLS93426.1 3-hydroxyisobutyrate dehydrogenase [Piscinibacter gummiphilus]
MWQTLEKRLNTTTDVTVIGLGPMGLALADLLLKAGRTVTLWNRSPGKADALVARGAVLAASPAEAIAASGTTLVCVLDYAAAETILAQDGVADAVRGRLVVNLGTGSPEDARRAEAWAHAHGARYLDGAIQAAPSQMGRPDTPLFVSGETAAFTQAEPLLRIVAGHLLHLGDAVDAAAFMDLATLSYVYGAYAGFLHGAHIAEVTGIDVATYGRLVHAIAPSFGAFFEHQGGVVAGGDFRATESPLRISVPAVRRILDTSRGLGINTELPGLVDGWLAKASARGLEGEELAALIKVLRR